MPTRWVGTPLRLAVPVVAPVSGLSPWVSVTHRSASTTTSRLAPSPLPHTHNPRPRPRTPPPPSPPPSLLPHRPSSSSASSRWKLRQSSDPFARSARVQGLKSRAAFKLLELDAKYHLFRRGKGQVVVDLGYAPGSWSQVAADRTAPNGTVVGIDIIPAQPPRGVSTIQGNFLDPGVQGMVKGFLLDGERRRVAERAKRREERKSEGGVVEGDEGEGGDEVADRPSYIDLERMAAHESEVEGGGVSSASEAAAATPSDPAAPSHDDGGAGNTITGKEEKPNLRLVDVRLPIPFRQSPPKPNQLTRRGIPPLPNTGGTQRHVSTLAPDPRLFHPQFE